MCFSPQPVQFFNISTSKSAPRPSVFNILSWKCASRHSAISTSQLQKVLRDRQFFNILSWKCASRHSGVQFFNISTSKSAPRPSFFFNILTWKCASRHSGVQFFDIVTSKSGPKLRCFVHFELEMRFSPQRRAIFEHLNFKKCSEPLSFLAFSLQNVLLATAACNFSTSQLQKVVRT